MSRVHNKRSYLMMARRACALLPVLIAVLAGACATSGVRQGAVAGKSAASPYRPDRFAGKAGRYYRLVWGIDDLRVNLAESGELVRFTWRVLDPDKAKVLHTESLAPALIDPSAGVSLSVPAMENIGKLRQDAPPEAGKSYWMVFSNKGGLVKRGDRVQVVIGEFRADGLAVD